MKPLPRKLAAVAGAAAIALSLPAATADAARPGKGTFFNGDRARGLLLQTQRGMITHLEFYCTGDNYMTRETRYEMREAIDIRRGGRFSYRGTFWRYGPEGQPYHSRKVKLSGRFTSRNHVRIKRRLSGCGTATVSANRTR